MAHFICVSTVWSFYFVIALFFKSPTSVESDYGCPDFCSCPHQQNEIWTICKSGGLTEIPTLDIPAAGDVIEIVNQNIETIHTSAFSNKKNLRRVVVSNSQVRNIQPNAFSNTPSLAEIDLSDNLLTTIPANVFTQLSNLKFLKFDSNNIGGVLSSGVFPVGSLTHLSLINNSIAALNEDLLAVFNGLENLRLSGNQLECNCNIVWFKKWVQSPNTKTTVEAWCRKPKLTPIKNSDVDEGSCSMAVTCYWSTPIIVLVMLVLIEIN